MGGVIMADKKTVFETLNAIDCKQHIKELQNNKYIPWSDAWYEVKKAFPLAYYESHQADDGSPFFASEAGIFIRVTVTIPNGEEIAVQTHDYPVLNGAMKSLKMAAYSYKVKEYANRKWTGKYIDKYVEPANSFDINTALMRGLTKCIALMGMALYIYRDEPEPEKELISSGQLQEIMDLIKEKGLTLSNVTGSWQLEKIAHLHAENFNKMIDWINQV